MTEPRAVRQLLRWLRRTSKLRQNDIALGGQGAPVAPIVEQYLLSGHDYYINLGGIANLSHHGPGGIVSFDNCPCNQVLNYYSQIIGHPYDKDGLLARKGEVDESLIQVLLSLPDFGKSCSK